MTNYFDRSQLDLAEANEDIYNEYERLMGIHYQNRSRYSLDDALAYDQKFINELLNTEGKNWTEEEAIKFAIASIFDQVAFEYQEVNETSCKFDNFVQNRLGPVKYATLIREWLGMQTNEFMNRVGMPEEMKPATIYLFRPKKGDQE